ncbi:uncharacterized protein LOC118645771 [Monomorium pharaonis]|uniref:uncharacterized protein LOC118645771 n=1 Tax=Monomorium pharaonis TaxID=307658 RepID=UPI001747B64E|nr:uncharacterized protein LOC118645771 [Monomorium pharaonis]
MSEELDYQLTHLHVVTRSLENFKKTGRLNYTPAKIRARIASLKEAWTQCIRGHAVLLRLYPVQERKGIAYFEEDQIEAHQEVYQTSLDFMTEWLEEMEPCVSPNRSAADLSLSRTETSSFSLQHLPPIQLPPFFENFTEWESFRDCFYALIIDNKDLSDYSHMHFLASSITGSARDVIAGIPITANNFSVAWKALLTRFENKRRLIKIHVATLHNLTPITRESAVELHTLHDKAEKAISALKCLNRSPEEMLSDILVYFVVQKLDPSTRRAWKIKGSTESAPLSFEDLIKFISYRALALEELTPLTEKPNRNVKSNNATLALWSSHAHYSPIQRREIVERLKRCFNCLSQKHSVNDCHTAVPASASANSAIAQSDHPVCDDVSSTPSQAVAMSSVSLRGSPVSVLLATAKIIVESEHRRQLTVRALIDQGSEVTFITEQLAQTLRLNRMRTFTTISAVGCSDAGLCRHAASVKIVSRYSAETTFTTIAFIFKSLTKYHPRCSQDVDNCQIILDGVRMGPIGLPVAQNSHFGRLISDPTLSPTSDAQSINVFHCALERELIRFWEIEDVPLRKFLSPAEQRCEEHFVTTHLRDVTGKYIMHLPFKTEESPDVGESRTVAMRSLLALNRRLQSNNELKTEYSAFLREYETLGHMKKISSPTELLKRVIYIPHHPVVRDSSSTTRVRVAFNASSLTTNGSSLNSNLFLGLKLQTDLTAVLLRWRQHRYEYQLLTVTYGTASAPFLALRVLKQLIIDEGGAFPLASSILTNHIYVDDVLFGAEDIPLLRCAREQVCDLLAKGGFTLRKWANNKLELLNDISSENYGLLVTAH